MQPENRTCSLRPQMRLRLRAWQFWGVRTGELPLDGRPLNSPALPPFQGRSP